MELNVSSLPMLCSSFSNRRNGSSLRHSVLIASVCLLTACDGGSSGGILDQAREGPGVLKGAITIEPGTRIDRDTALAIEEGRVQERDDEDNPQYAQEPLSGTITLGGYVSGSEGRYGTGFRYPEDDIDAVRLDLKEGETVSIEVFPAAGMVAPELSFELNELENGGDSQQAEGASTSLVAAQSGTHDLIIRADSGDDPARYIVRVEQTETTATEHQSRDFVPGEAVITTESMGRAGQIQTQSQAPMAARAQASLGSNRFHVQMPDTAMSGVSGQSLAQARTATLEWIRELQASEGIESATPNYHVTPQDNGRDRSWHHQLINVEQAWDEAGVTGSGVRLAVLDTGVLRSNGAWHPGLAGNIACGSPGRCFDAIDGDNHPEDTSGEFHGTHVAGIAAATEEPEDGVDPDRHLRGIAYEADLVPVRVLGGSEGTLADVIAGVDWVVNDGNPRAEIMNLSLGGLNQSPALESALEEADEAGVLVTAAAGNRSDRLEFYPAAYPSVLAVGSVNCDRERSSFSSFGDWLTLSAPGGGNADDCSENRVYSTFGDPGDESPNYSWLAGTSMAAPQVAGIIALMLDHHEAENLEPEVLRAMIREGLLTDPPGGDEGSFDLQRGRGIIDAARALDDDLEPDSYAAFAPSRDQLRLSDARQNQSIAFERVGHADTTLSDLRVSVVDDPDWLESPEPSGDQEFQISLSDDIAPGRAYQGLLEVSYRKETGRDVSYQIPVSAITGDAVENREAGVHFVQLIREDDFEQGQAEPVREVRAEFNKGQYEFEIDTSDLDAGNYLLIAGSDIDNNGVIGEVGEAYAVWTENDDDSGFATPDPIRVTRNMKKTVEMKTSFLSAEDTGVPSGRALKQPRD